MKILRENFILIDYLIYFLIYECFVFIGEIVLVGFIFFEFVVLEGSFFIILLFVGIIEFGKVLIVGFSIRKIYY